MEQTYEWTDVRDQAVRAFKGETPGNRTEQAIIDVFTRRPDVVVASLAKISSAFANGTIRSGWAVLKSDVEKADARAEHTHVVAVDKISRNTAIQHAEQWMRSAGVHYPTADEVLEHLFGPTGNLRSWANDTELQSRLVQQWLDLRPSGIATDEAAEQRIQGDPEAVVPLAPEVREWLTKVALVKPIPGDTKTEAPTEGSAEEAIELLRDQPTPSS
jgi:hypothetical protein